MAFTVNDYRDLIELLNQRPDWRSELRQLILTDEVVELPAIVRRLAEAQERTEARLERLEAAVQSLAAAQERTEAQVKLLVESQQRIEQQLAEYDKQFKEHLLLLRRHDDKIGDLQGWRLESAYRERPYSYFGDWLRKARAVPIIDLPGLDEAYENGLLTDEEWKQLMALDALVKGRLGRGASRPEVYVAVEISAVIDMKDVARAAERAQTLRRLGYSVIAAVGGYDRTLGVETMAAERGVVLTMDGSSQFLDEALATLPPTRVNGEETHGASSN